jgi:hypothetical protein
MGGGEETAGGNGGGEGGGGFRGETRLQSRWILQATVGSERGLVGWVRGFFLLL